MCFFCSFFTQLCYFCISDPVNKCCNERHKFDILHHWRSHSGNRQQVNWRNWLFRYSVLGVLATFWISTRVSWWWGAELAPHCSSLFDPHGEYGSGSRRQKSRKFASKCWILELHFLNLRLFFQDKYFKQLLYLK